MMTEINGLVLDLRGLSFVDSAGLLAVVNISREAHDRHVRLWIVRGPEGVDYAFRITGLDKILPFVDEPPVL
jgi:anti-anti-sigma factor